MSKYSQNVVRVRDILENSMDARNSHFVLIEQFRMKYPNCNISSKTIENYAGIIQNALGIFPPTERIKNMRREYRDKYTRTSMVSKFTSFIKKIF